MSGFHIKGYVGYAKFISFNQCFFAETTQIQMRIFVHLNILVK